MTLAEQIQHTPILILGVLESCLAIAFLSLWRAAPDFRVFRILGFFYAVLGLEQCWQYSGGSNSVWAIRTLAVILLIQTAAEAVQIPNRRWTWLLWPICLFTFLAGWLPSMAFVREWPVLSSQVFLAIIITQGFRRGSRRDRMIAAAFTVHLLVRSTLSPTLQRLTGIKNSVRLGGWVWQYTSITLTLLGAVTLAIFVRDLVRDRREKMRLATELEAGRAVQQVLIPHEVPSVPGFAVETEYRPYGEVGGDFFQLLPLPGGGVMVAIGDVSGKGMQAAMTVSLLLGALLLAVEASTRPREILRALNRTLSGRSRGGFTTCLVLRVDADGRMSIANAGHIAPYLDGHELALENGLPLGLAEDAVYEEFEFQLRPGKRLTLMTDGVVEARSASGELFGFERTAEMSTLQAETIAERAQTFGQDDDITVLTLVRA